MTWNFDVSFDLCPNKRLSKQSWGWWFETPSPPVWRHCNVTWNAGPHNLNVAILFPLLILLLFAYFIVVITSYHYDDDTQGHFFLTWWRHQMETFSALLALCAGNSPVPGEFPAQRPVRRSFDVFFDLRPNKRLSKQSWGWWFETPSRSLWRHCNGVTNLGFLKRGILVVLCVWPWAFFYNIRLTSYHGNPLHWRHNDQARWRLKSPASRLFAQPPVCSGRDQEKHQGSALLAFVRESTGHRLIKKKKASNAENVSIWWRHHALMWNFILN